MIKNYLILAWRNLWKNKISSSVNLICLALGMACCMLILVYLQDELSFNRFNANYENIYRIDWTSNSSGERVRNAVTPVPLGPAAISEIPALKSLARLYQRSGAMELKNEAAKGPEKKKFQEQNVFFADNALFSIFSIPFIKGTPSNALSSLHGIVLTDEMAKKYFGDSDPMGKSLLYDTKTSLQVTAVVKKMPANSDLQFDFLISFETLFDVEVPDMAEFIRTDWTFNPVTTYCLMRSPSNAGQIESELNSVLYRHGNDRNKKLNTILLQPLSKIHLYASDVYGNPGTGSIKYVYIFGGIALLILVIAVFNFVNLATAQAGARSREVGMRKVLGANKKQLVFQFLSEAMLLSFCALLASLFIVQCALPLLNVLTAKQLCWNSWFNLPNLLLFSVIFILVAFAAGSYPAFFISRFNTILSLKGKSGESTRKNYLRKTLLVTQFSISIVLIVSAVIIYQQLSFLRNKPLGFQKEYMLSVPIFGSGSSSVGYGVDGPMRQRMNTFYTEVSKSNRVKSVTAASALPGQFYIPGLVIPEGFSEKDNIFVPWLCVDYNFIPTFSMSLVAGRGFSKETGTDHLSAFIINESAVKAFGWKSPQDALNKKIIRGDETNGKRGTIIGVIKDHHFNSLDQPIQSLIMDVNVPRFSFFAVNIQPDHIPETIAWIEQQWNTLFPERVFEYSFLDSDIDALYRDNENLSKVIGCFALIAVILSCLGLFSLSSFLTSRRVKEIGIRKVLGASLARILALLSVDFLKLVLIAAAIATPLAFYMNHSWLRNYAYRIDIQWWVFLLAGGLVLVLTALTVIFQSSKVALTNPAKSLKTE